ncbi:hypothetical protein CLV73_1237 [Chryseobacterium geocarposphaerae]|uniref:Uncharacterized protein n=1 Tax=Chryseobacterium geocarposphaerae TaxID=1416776 RepID=A0A2M9C8T2_9FLAO|nr:hypothetical protein CLV73_1237 [Chryseobacterium geocarposphaerae]
MNFHNQFTTAYFLIVLCVLTIANFVVIRQRKLSWKLLLDWKIILFTLIITFLGLLYTEISVSKDWKIETYGFPKYFYLKKSSIGKDNFLSFGIVRFHFINFVQNFILFYLLVNLIWIIKTKKRNKIY